MKSELDSWTNVRTGPMSGLGQCQNWANNGEVHRVGDLHPMTNQQSNQLHISGHVHAPAPWLHGWSGHF
jgi:hypothetical protein